MRDYEEIVNNLRCCRANAPCDDCTYQDDIEKCASLERQAADAIEELLAAFCLLCGICTSPPSDETFYSCEIVRGCLPEPPKEVQDG